MSILNNNTNRIMWLCNKLLYFGTVFAVLNVSSARTTWTSRNKLTRENFVDVVALCNFNKACIKEVNEILKYIDFAIDPCDDFYNFTCGTLLKNIQEGGSGLFSDKESSKILQDIHSLVKTDILKTDMRPIKLVKNYFQSCLNLNLNVKPVLELFTQLGGWPLITKKWNAKNFNLFTALAKLSNIGFKNSYAINLDITPDPSNSTKFIVELNLDLDNMTNEYLRMDLDNKYVQTYISKLVEFILNNINNKTDSEYLENELMNAIKFEINLAKISLTAQQKSNKSLRYKVMTINKATKKYPYIPWLDFIKSTKLAKTVQFTKNDNIKIMDTKFFERLGIVLKKTSKRDQANYIMLKVLLESFNYTKVPKNNEIATNPKWAQLCVEDLTEKFGLALGSMYVKKFKDNETIKIVSKMAYKIRDQIITSIKQSTWMDQKTRKIALKKLSTIKFIISHPKELEEDNKIVDYYAMLEDMKPKEYFLNLFKLNKFDELLNISSLKNRNKQSDNMWLKSGAETLEINGYNFFPNTVIIPAGLLRGTIYSKNQLNSINYGSLGFIIGHELIHSIDSDNRNYDENGNLVNWWKKTEQKFLKKTKCVEDFYNNFHDESNDQTEDGITTLAENIADIGGVKHAFLAYNDTMKQLFRKSQIKSRYVAQSNKLFWIGFAQTLCDKTTEEFTEDEHSPSHFRVVGSLQNSKYFSETFGCRLRSPMNPVHKCEVW